MHKQLERLDAREGDAGQYEMYFGGLYDKQLPGFCY